MKALLDTNIIIHREASRVINQDIGILFKWLDKVKYEKFIHPVTIREIEKYKDKSTVESFQIKLNSYHQLYFILCSREEHSYLDCSLIFTSGSVWGVILI